MNFRHLLRVLALMILFLAQTAAASRGVMAQQAERAAAEQLLAAMSVEERVGQVFLVTFDGAAIDEEDTIVELVNSFHIGGVVLRVENSNIAAPPDSAVQLAKLTADLQQLALSGRLPTPPSEVDDTLPPVATDERIGGIPLFIAANQEGNGPPHSLIWHDVTEMPSKMAIGATWSPEFATTAGAILGEELAALGINMLLGPSLDVLENPAPLSASDLGSRAFGGDPYWVGLLGQGYIRGVHGGSDGRLAVIGKHFPGYGSSDRPLNEEVSTVRKSLEQLKQIELAPFFAVTGDAPDPAATVDGLLTSHIRYQGFQGNIRATTAPVSFDPQALAALMALDEFAPWREAGGVIVSDALGVRAVQRYYDDREQEFPHRQVAKDAFLAGNDLLYVADFAVAGSDRSAELANIRDTILWFQDKYRTDPSFRQRVDEAVVNILQLKLRLYGEDFAVENVAADPERVTAIVGRGDATLFTLAQAAVTLVSPSPAELSERLPQPPGQGDSITIFTDARTAQQCPACAAEQMLSEDAFASRMLALYGPTASGQIRADQIRSFTFADLSAFLTAGPNLIPPPPPAITPTLTPDPAETATPGPSPTPFVTPTPAPEFQVQEAVRESDWIIFLMQDIDPAVAHSNAVRRFLAERPDIARRTRVIVFALDAPYFLDTTEISQLTAYFGVFSKADAFIDAAVRALFLESPLTGASPVDIEGIGYDLFEMTQPDPGQIIDLFLAEDGEARTPDDTPLELSAGDILNLQTGVIRDRNGRPVPDGTIVQFIRQNLVDGFVDLLADRPTRNGIAAIDYVLEGRSGQFRITATAGAAMNSQVIDINTGENVEVIFITLTPAPTEAPTETPAPTVSPSPSPSATPSPAPTPPPPPAGGEPSLQISLSEFQMLFGLIGGLVAVALLAWLPFRNGRAGQFDGAASLQLRLAAWGLFGGLLAYNYFALALPGADLLVPLGAWAGFTSAITGGLLGMAVPWLRLRG